MLIFNNNMFLNFVLTVTLKEDKPILHINELKMY